MVPTYSIFTDISFNRKQNIAVAGSRLLYHVQKDQSDIIELMPIQTIHFQEANNIRAELRGAIYALEIFEKYCVEHIDHHSREKYNLQLYTDCQTVASLPERKKRLEDRCYFSQRQKKPLSNADLYQLFFQVYKRTSPQIIWIKGHCPRRKKLGLYPYFSDLDKEVRRHLREILR